MKVTIFVKNQTEEHQTGRKALEKALLDRGVEIVEWNGGAGGTDMVISIGGDGTLLGAVHLIGTTETPVVGINFGHLGFLTTAGRDDIDLLVDSLCSGDYSIETRTMLDVNIYTGVETKYVRALNEVYLHRCDSSPMLHTEVELNGEVVATYAADGLIVATPTGSTAYSLSCGGPILAPGSGGLVLTPIAAHTLTQRPIVVSDSVHLRLRDSDPAVTYTLGVDSSSFTLGGNSVVDIRKSDHKTRLVRIGKHNFFSAIHDKLMWGV